MLVKKSKEGDSNRENIPLKLDKNTFSRYFPWFNTINPDSDKMLFFINTPYRQYNVPEHSWKEYAEVIEIINDSLHKFEEKKLKEYLDYYNDGKVDDRKND